MAMAMSVSRRHGNKVLPDLLQHLTAVLPDVHWLCADACDVRARLAHVAVELRAEQQLEGLREVLLANGSLQLLAGACALHVAHLLCSHAKHLLRRLREGREPSLVREVGVAAPDVHASCGFACLVAGGTESAVVKAALAGQGLALPWLLAGHVGEGLSLTLLAELHESQAAHHIEGHLLRRELLRCGANLGQSGVLGVLRCQAAATAGLREGGEVLGGASLGPPLLQSLRLRQRGVEVDGSTGGQGACQTAVPLLDVHALEGNNGAALELAVRLLGPLVPDCDSECACGVVC
mmetsp:Transcript_74012/g.176162  ORF Transcript_74012/g.176162 Transcript_74012/m.176162 type:complete len:293 (+) Transcript_74012:241-1119(+)